MRTTSIALALALLPSLSAAAGPRRELDPEHRAAIHSTRVVVHVEPAAVRPIVGSMLGNGDSAYPLVDPPRKTGLIGVAAHDHWEELKPLRDALQGYDPSPLAVQALGAELGQLDLFRGAAVDLQPGPGIAPTSAFPGLGMAFLRRERSLDRDGVAALIRGEKSDALLVVNYDLLISPKYDRIVVTAMAKLFANPASTSKVISEFSKLTPSVASEPVPAMYRTILYAVMSVPEGEGTSLERWSAGGAAAARRAIDGGVAEIARLLAYDIQQGKAPKRQDTSIAKEREGDFVEAYIGAPPALLYNLFVVREAPGRLWARQDDGVLASSGAANPDLPPPPTPAAPPKTE